MPAVLSKNAKNVFARAKTLYLCRAGFAVVEMKVNSLQLCLSRTYNDFVAQVKKADLEEDATGILMCENLANDEVKEVHDLLLKWGKKYEGKASYFNLHVIIFYHSVF